MSAQSRPLEEVSDLQERYECPNLCAGDIFDRSRKIADGWNASPELINFAIDCLPDMYAIPGQHDLPQHQYEDIHRSAYWTLVEAGKIKNILPNDIKIINNYLAVYGFPPGYKIERSKQNHNFDEDGFVIAVVHDYVWIKGSSYPDAPKDKSLQDRNNTHNKIYDGKLYGYDVIVYGDNHKGFSKRIGETIIFNCGTLMRRKSDEIDYKPQVGLLLSNGEVVPHYLDISQDKYIEKAADTEVNDSLDMSEFFNELEKLGNSALDFKEAMKQFLHSGKTLTEVKQIILDAMEK